jgi:putative membrane protein
MCVHHRRTLMADDLYAWFRAFHVVAVIAWMAGMLYLPRLYVYHARAATGSELSEILKIMERRLLRAIINPAMIVSIGLAGALLAEPGAIDWSSDIWIYLKLAFVVLLTAFHGMLARWRRDFANDRNRHSERFYRIMNEVPTLVMIGIVVFVIVKPF